MVVSSKETGFSLFAQILDVRGKKRCEQLAEGNWLGCQERNFLQVAKDADERDTRTTFPI